MFVCILLILFFFYSLVLEYGFTTESLKYLKSRHLNEIIPKALYGSRVIFEYKLENWQRNQVIFYS